MFDHGFKTVGRLMALLLLFAGALCAQDHAYDGTLGIWYEPINNYGVNDTSDYLKWMNQHPDWHHNPGLHLLKQQGGAIYSIEQPDRFAKFLRTMRRATSDVIVVDSLDCHTDPWSYSIHYFSDALENQPANEKQLRWVYWLELWSTDRYGGEWYGPRWTRWKPRGAPYQPWSQVQQVLDYIWDNFAQKQHYYHWSGKPMLVIEADLIGKEKPEWFERIMADKRFYVHFVCDTVHDLADYPSNWTDWVWPYWVDINPKFNSEWAAALSGSAGEGKNQLEGLFDKRTGKSPAGGNSDPPKFILIPAYNDYVTGRDPKKSGWFEPFFDENGHMSRFQYVDQIADILGRPRKPIDLDTEGKHFTLQPTVDRLSEILENDRQNYGMGRIRDISSDEYQPGAEDMPVLSVELFPYRGYETAKSFETISSMSIRNVGTAEFSKTQPAFTEIQTLGDIDHVWLMDVSSVDGSRTRVGEFVLGRDGVMHWLGQYPVHFKDLLVVTVDLTPTARKGHTLQFELVVDKANGAKAVEFVQEYGSERFSPEKTIRNKYAQTISADLNHRKTD